MFRSGDTVVFDINSFNPNSWNSYTNNEKVKYYGDFVHLKYNTMKMWDDRTNSWIEYKNNCADTAIEFEQCKPKLMTFICEHHPQTGHCVLMDMSTGKLYPMCHPSNFRLVDDDEC